MLEIIDSIINRIKENTNAGKQIELPDGVIGVLVPENMQIRTHQSINAIPATFINSTFTAHDYDTFIDYVKKFAGAESVILADIDSSTFHCIFDFHKPDGPGRLQHIATYTPKPSLEWAAWSKFANGGARTQAEVVEFLEVTAATDVRKPSPATILEMTKNLEIHRKEEVRSIENAFNGNREVVFKQKDTDANGGAVKLPESMEIAIPLYFGGPGYKVPIRIRYRMNDGQLKFEFIMERIEYIKAAAFQALIADTHPETGEIVAGLLKDIENVPVWHGRTSAAEFR
jgi:uncharacterized protein YfdQ (DUF2303 family)